ncbi:hypothetical protein JMM81_19690 [Bacillus sp. V3B]|uniref:hypothetical protein n=1 Tax=Bacillus sp. V3B TaxID=2804915 RepID=UPI00210CD333|nr:hypothetical protein [Bacillus sp. V3B]MCQ6277101.1 hypothetical protein [Bacillus sp. V3B]
MKQPALTAMSLSQQLTKGQETKTFAPSEGEQSSEKTSFYEDRDPERPEPKMDDLSLQPLPSFDFSDIPVRNHQNVSETEVLSEDHDVTKTLVLGKKSVHVHHVQVPEEDRIAETTVIGEEEVEVTKVLSQESVGMKK